MARAEKHKAIAGGFAVAVLMQVSYLLLVAAYFMSVYQAYQANGLGKALLIAIPGFGQFLWFGIMWQSVGFLNPFTYVVLTAFASFGTASLIASATGHTVSNPQRKRRS